ncbi:MAG: tyrosine-type recombinase/integrase, partial [Planctomycetota bacterium]
RKEAERFVQQKKDEFEAGLPRDERHITLKQLCKKFLSVNQKEYTNGTLQNYQDTITRLQTYFHPTISIKQIRQEHAQEFIAQMDFIRQDYERKNEELSDSARNIVLRNCKKIWNTAVDWQYIIDNPFKKIKQVKATTQPWHRITVDEFNRIIEHTPTLRKQALYSVLYGCGFRLGEGLNILANGQNINFDAGVITIRNRPATKTIPPFSVKDKEDRTVPMPKRVSEILKQLYQELDPDCPFIFMTKERWAVVQQTWKRMRQEGRAREWQNWRLVCNPLRDFKIYCKRAGIQTDEKINLHGLRKGWACNLAENGISPKTLCELGGWSDPSVLHEYYSKATDANRDRARQVLDDLMGE